MNRPRVVLGSVAFVAGAAALFACLDSADNAPDASDGVDARAPSSGDSSIAHADTAAPSADAPAAGDDAANVDAQGEAAAGDDGGPPAPYAYFCGSGPGGASTDSIYSYAVSATGAFTPIGNSQGTPGIQLPARDCVTVAALPNGHFLYAPAISALYTYSVSAGGALARVNVTGDAGSPDFTISNASLDAIAADPKGRVLYVTDNANAGRLYTLSIDANTGAPTLVSTITIAPGPHAIAVDPQARFLYLASAAANIDGLVTRFILDGASGIPIAPDAGGTANLRLGTFKQGTSVALDPAGRAYVVIPGQLLAVAYDSDAGALFSPGVVDAGSPRVVAVDSNGAFAYVTSYVDKSLATYALAPDGGAPVPVGAPLGTADAGCAAVAFDPSGAHLIVECDSQLLTYSVNASTGALTPAASVQDTAHANNGLAIVK